jgi:hypothetical protein
VIHYYIVLRKVLQKEPQLRKQITRCKECGIFFLSDARNSRRRDLRCPFGCRETRRRESSARRSAAYYSTQTGKDKKKEQNAQRNRQNKNPGTEDPSNTKTIIPVINHTVTKEHLSYIQNILCQIEHRFIPQKEIQRLLIKKWRQHSIDNNQKEAIISNLGKIIILRE